MGESGLFWVPPFFSNMHTQICSVCEIEKPETEFHFRQDRMRYRPNCKLCRNKQEVTKRYNISLEELDRMFDEQEHCCAICHTHVSDVPHKSFGNPLVVDHSHTTGEVRGLLCPTCNSGLGHFKDNPELLSEAVRYLNKFL